jgi:hypothetical protein
MRGEIFSFRGEEMKIIIIFLLGVNEVRRNSEEEVQGERLDDNMVPGAVSTHQKVFSVGQSVGCPKRVVTQNIDALVQCHL